MSLIIKVSVGMVLSLAVLFVLGLLYVPTEQAFGAIQTLGQTSNNASSQTQSADRKYVNPATAGASGTVVSGVARIWNSGSGDSSSRLVIYANVSTNCATTEVLLAASDETILPTGGSESAVAYTFSGLNQISIVNGVSYCIGVHFSDPGTGNVNISRANSAAPVRSDVDTYSDGPTATCSCTTSSNGPLDLYIEFEDGVGGIGTASIEDDVVFFQ